MIIEYLKRKLNNNSYKTPTIEKLRVDKRGEITFLLWAEKHINRPTFIMYTPAIVEQDTSIPTRDSEGPKLGDLAPSIILNGWPE